MRPAASSRCARAIGSPGSSSPCGERQKARGPHAEVALGIADHVARALDAAVVQNLNVDRVGEVDENEDALQKMHAVLAPARDVQKEIELGWSRKVGEPGDDVRHGVSEKKNDLPAENGKSEIGRRGRPSGRLQRPVVARGALKSRDRP